MQSGFIADSDVLEFRSRILVDGVERPHISWSVDRELSGDLPQQIVAGSGLTQATGSIVWAPVEGVSPVGGNPWNASGWWPRKGAKVEIFVAEGASEWKQFTGVLDHSTGEVGGSVQSTIIDGYDKLSARLSHDALLRIMPPLTDTSSYRGAGLVSTYYVDLAMRSAGFYTTPDREPGVCILAPFQGGAWPHVGTLSTAESFDGLDRVPTNKPTKWGFGIGNARLTYIPHWVEPASVPVQLTIMVGDDNSADCNFDVNYSSGWYVRMSVRADGRVIAMFGTVGSFGTACTLSAARMAGATVVTMLVKGSSFSLMNDRGESVSGTGTAPEGTVVNATVNAWPNAVVGGFMMNYATSEYLEHRPSRTFVPSARIGTGNVTHYGTMGACRAIESGTAIDLLTEISEAALAGMWIDEFGVLRWEPSIVLRDQPSSAIVSTREHVLALGWEDSLLGARSSVTVKFKEPSISVSRYQMVEVWRGSSSTLASGDSKEDIISPSEDEAWVMVDTDYTRVGNYQGALYNSKRGSYMGVVYTKDGEYYTSVGMPTGTEMSKIGPSAWKLTHSVGTLPAGVQAETRTPDDAEFSEGYYSWNKNNDLPLVQAGGRVQWYDAEVTPDGPSGAGAELVHDAGIWVAPSIAENIAQFLQAQTVSPQPSITSLSVVPDPRIQLADTIQISAPDLMGVVMRCLVTGVSLSFDSGGLTQSLSVRVASVTRSSQTYEAFDSSLPDGELSYQQWQALGPTPETYSHFNES